MSLSIGPVISPPKYSHDFLLYVAAFMETIGMVLVQEDEELQEHVENLALATVHAIQRLRHYILLHQTLVVAHVNPF